MTAQLLALALTLMWHTAELLPTGLGTLDADISDLSYQVEEEDLDDFLKLLEDDEDVTPKSDATATKIKASGFKKKNAINKGLKSSHDIQDLKNFFKTAGVHDQGAYDDDAEYAVVEGLAAQAVGVTGDENRKYRKGTKTRGFHRVHHKDEYKKDKIYYEDDETTGNINKVGAKALGLNVGGGIGYAKKHFHHDRQKGIYGKQGKLDKGRSNKELSGYSDSQGLDASFSSAS